MLLAQRAPQPPARLPLPSQRRLFFAAAGLLIAGETVFWTVLAAVQSNSGVAALDAPVHDGLVASRNPLATAILTAVTTVTSPVWMTVIGCAVALAWAAWKREVWRPALLIGAMAATFAVSTLIKHDVGRGRPAASDFMLGPDDALSFPSGHTFGAGVFLCVLSYLLVAARGTRTTSVLAFAAAAAGTLVVAFSRLYLGYHWLTDVLAALGLALAVTGIVILADGLRATMAPRPAPLAPAALRSPPAPAEVRPAEVNPAEVNPAGPGPSEPDAHRLGDHNR
ncbi:phosphatase PAP2 family protein [Arthrobacter sp. ES3-54]|uniref:phosphatase PAP2 family protein n=1 Tax=Arthrobacter sp. ES3-54 TaxID=1502991 RepID=UPI002404C628|nr:phosphatase PAP2 family protein [Arthrobacter sp. ES3-54]MDF9751430.1 membrane-associated phospholipid phosphatase [Arthrobacter sp. ES3-54]